MQIHVARNGKSLGVFSPEEVQANIAQGKIARDDIGWKEGMEQWKPLEQVIAFPKEISGGLPAQCALIPPKPDKNVTRTEKFCVFILSLAAAAVVRYLANLYRGH